MTDLLAALSLAIGTFFFAVSAIGLLRLPDVYSRMHAITKASTLGMAGALGSSMILFAARGDGVYAEAFAMWFIFLTNPVGGHMIARSAYLIGVSLWEFSVIDELSRHGDRADGDHDTF